MGENRNKRLTVTLDDYVIKIAEEKAKLMFKGDINNYINWLICSNNKQEVKKIVEELDKKLSMKKPVLITGSEKNAMYNNVCAFCNKPIYQGDEICKAEGYDNYIHKKCSRKNESN